MLPVTRHRVEVTVELLGHRELGSTRNKGGWELDLEPQPRISVRTNQILSISHSTAPFCTKKMAQKLLNGVTGVE